MDIKMTMPNSVEGSWRLLDDAGNEVTNSDKVPTATLIIMPKFYKNTNVQTLTRMTIQGNKGRTREQSIRVSGGTGVARIEETNRIAKQVTPTFDRQPPAKETKKHERATGPASTTGTSSILGRAST